MEIISKNIKIKSPSMPPDSNFIENKIKQEGMEPIRRAIVNIEDNILTLSVSGIQKTN